MRPALAVTLPAPPAVASFTPVDLDQVAATRFLHNLAPRPGAGPPSLLIDCGHLKCLRTLGVSHVVSELLVLHQGGARVFLRNVGPALRRCLQLLRLETLFTAL